MGLIPAAGKASRLGRLPCSKELLPLGYASGEPPRNGDEIRVAIDDTLQVMTTAGILQTCVVIAHGKWDIPSYIASGARQSQTVAYLVTEDSQSVPASLDSAYPFTKRHNVALLFPDIFFEPKIALKDIIEHRRTIDADLVLALVPSSDGEKIDIVSVSDKGLVSKVTPKPGGGCSGWTWVAAVWNPRFTEFLHQYMAGIARETASQNDHELYVADVINASIDSGSQVCALTYPDGESYDLGTHQELDEFWRYWAFDRQ